MTVTPRPSIRRVAAQAGVSRTTVSRVLNGHNGEYSDETRARVLEVVRELEYVPVAQPSTQSRHVETRTIGLVFDSIELRDAWGLPTYHGLCEGAQAHGYDLLTMFRAPADWMLDSHELHFLDRRSDGLVFLVPKERTRVLETLVRHRIPAVSCYVDDVPQGVATVVLDNIGTMKRATEYLIERNHQKILHVAGIKERADFRARRKSYESAMKAAKLQARSVQVQQAGDQSWLSEIEKLLMSRAITAIVCASDHYAMEVLRLAKSLKIRAPRDFSIIAMDDLPEAAAHGLTTFRFSCADIGRYAVEAAVRMIAGEDYRACSRVLPVEIVERNSVASLKS